MKKSRTPLSAERDVAGFTLIEVMVALIVLVLGVLGASAMMLTALRDNKQSALRTQATALAYELSDLMRYSGAVQESVFTGPAPTAGVPTCFVATGCVASDMALNDYYGWRTKLIGSTTPLVLGLPNASAKICRDVANPNSMSNCDQLATSPLVVKLKWDEKYNNGTFVADALGADIPNLVVPLRPY